MNKLTEEIRNKIKKQKIILRHDSSVKALNQILTSIFPRSGPAEGTNLYYYASYVDSHHWNCGNVMRNNDVEFISVSELTDNQYNTYDLWFT